MAFGRVLRLRLRRDMLTMRLVCFQEVEDRGKVLRLGRLVIVAAVHYEKLESRCWGVFPSYQLCLKGVTTAMGSTPCPESEHLGHALGRSEVAPGGGCV